jgi:hypothetical protein
MRKLVCVASVTSVALLLGGCAAHSRLGRPGGPDEFAVARQAPLVIPPDFSLAPPQPGAARANDISPNAQALDALFGGSAPRSAGEGATLSAAGADGDDAGIRSSVDDPATNVVDKGASTRDVVAAPQGDGQNARVTPSK